MRDLTKQQCFLPQTGIIKTARMPLRLSAIVTGILLSIMPLLTGCGGGEGGGEVSAAPVGATASLAWHPVQDPSVFGYFVHYGRESPDQRGSCSYETSLYIEDPSVTVTNLDPDTRYYFTVSAYNGLESVCSSEVSTVTPPVQTDPREPSPGTERSVQTDPRSPSFPGNEMPSVNTRG
jgi:Fibronectin type III domain